MFLVNLLLSGTMLSGFCVDMKWTITQKLFEGYFQRVAVEHCLHTATAVKFRQRFTVHNQIASQLTFNEIKFVHPECCLISN